MKTACAGIAASALLLCLSATAAQDPEQAAHAKRYVIHGATVHDTRSGLAWQRCSVGQQWDGSRCTGKIMLATWYRAQEFASGDWRLPTKNELDQLVDYEKRRQWRAPFIDTAAFPDVNATDALIYWTSSRSATGCFAMGFSTETRDAGFNAGFTTCVIFGAVRLVSGPIPQRRPWME